MIKKTNYLKKLSRMFTIISILCINNLLGASSVEDLSLFSSNLNSLAEQAKYTPKKPDRVPTTPQDNPLNPNLSSSYMTYKSPVISTQPTQPRTFITRNQFFDNVVGQTEDAFRKAFNWDNVNFIVLTPEQKKLGWIQQYPRRAAIFQGEYKMYTPEIMYQRAKMPFKTQPYFRVIIHNPLNRQQTDVGYLQAHPSSKNANFQIASTFFGPLEGGMSRRTSLLTGMLHSPVQGEEASISAAPATIFRKYFMPQDYLLHNLEEYFEKAKGKYADHAVLKENLRSNLTDLDSLKVGIGIHKNIVVTSGYSAGTSGRNGRPGEYDQQEELPVTVVNGKVDSNSTQTIHQIFNAAYDFGHRDTRRSQPSKSEKEWAAKIILDGMYLGTILAPWITDSPVIFLTLLGAGAFRNNMDTIAESITRLKEIIKKNGLQVTLIYRPDPGKETRGDTIDYQFLKKIFEMADFINGTNLAQDTTFNKLLNSYTQSAYGNDTQTQSSAAVSLNTMINTYLPLTAPKIEITRSYVPPTTSPTSPDRTKTSLGWTKFLQLNNGDTIGWLRVQNDAVLINIGPNSTPTLSPQQNFIYINPDVPSGKLPKGLYFWQSQGFLRDIGKRDTNNPTPVKNNAKGKDYIYDTRQKKYVDSHHRSRVWDPTRTDIRTIDLSK